MRNETPHFLNPGQIESTRLIYKSLQSTFCEGISLYKTRFFLAKTVIYKKASEKQQTYDIQRRYQHAHQ